MLILAPVLGPLLLLGAGVVAMSSASGRADGTSPRIGRLLAICAVLAFGPVAVLDLVLSVVIPYVGLLVGLVVFPIHFACVVALAAGIAAFLRTGRSTRAPALVLPPMLGLVAGFALVAIRFAIVPQSNGVFLETFDASGSKIEPAMNPLDPHGQKDMKETLGVHQRSLHEPLAALGEDSLWTISRDGDDECTGRWIRRMALEDGAPEWRRCLETEAGVTQPDGDGRRCELRRVRRGLRRAR